jgi:hypothetical protein
VGADMKPGDPADRATDAKADGAFQGSHRAGYGDRLARVEDWLRRHPTATLASGEGAVLLAEIDRLREELATAHAAIDRVVALHTPPTAYPSATDLAHCGRCRDLRGLPQQHPCTTLRALDGEAA